MVTSSIALIVVGILNFLAVVVMIFFEQKKTGIVLSWAFVMSLLPIVGFVIYLLFGSGLGIKTRIMLKKTNLTTILNYNGLKGLVDKEVQSEQFYQSEICEKYKDLIAFNRNNSHSLLKFCNNVEVFNSGVTFIDSLLKDIENAKNNIHMDYFIFCNDKTGKRVIKALTNKVKEGVEVKILVDSIGSFSTRKRHFKHLIKAGGQYKEFFPSIIRMVNFKVNYRNHRKITVIDGKIGYVGGTNIRDDHMGMHKKLSPWYDVSMRIEGNSVQDLQTVFFSDWRYATKDYRSPLVYLQQDYFPQEINKGDTALQIITSGPNNNKQEIKMAMLKMIGMAKTKIMIQTPYFVPDDVVLESLYIAIKSGIKVEIMVPSVPDKFMVYRASLSYLRQLNDCGAKIYFYKGFLHAKTLIIDGEIMTIGTCNMDYRSYALNFEINAIIYDKIITENYVKSFENCVKYSIINKDKLLNNPTIFQKFWMAIFRLFSPLL